MLRLDQIEPRTPISAAPYVITNPGSYYLVSNLNVATGNAIEIATNGVTLDLNGFTLFSTEPTNTGTAIQCDAITDVTILNGHIVGGVIFSGSSYAGPGFGRGIWFPSTQPSNVRVVGVTVSGCLLDGINLGSGSATVVQGCTVNTVGGYGIGADCVSDSTAYQCGTAGIAGTTAQNCYATTTADSGLGIFCRNVNNCSAFCSGASSYGIYSLGVVNNSYGQTASGTGIYAGTATGCQGYSFSGTGLNASTVENCYGSGSDTGINAGTALNSSGTTSNGVAVYANTAQNCSGVASGNGRGILAAYLAQNCYGSSNGSGIGLLSYYVAIGCFGQSASSGNGLVANVCQNCYGLSNSHYGLTASYVAIGCYGFTFSGTALYSYIANSSLGQTPSGLSENVTYKYNMP
jgi:hypothetical protein